MCLIVLARGASPRFPFIMNFNRDEFYQRPTREAHWWEDVPHVLGGRDSERGGVWGGIRYSGEIALLTFWRQGPSKRSPFSRGEIVANYLKDPIAVKDYVEILRKNAAKYLGYNLIFGSIDGELAHYSNVTDVITPIGDGIWGLSNADINTPWPKVRRTTGRMAQILTEEQLHKEQLFEMMADDSFPDISELPDTGIGIEREKILSPIFIRDSDYGTRSTTVVLLERSGTLHYHERTFSSPWTDKGEVNYSWRMRYVE